MAEPKVSVRLPPPQLEGSLSVEAAIARRRSVRRYAPQPLSLAQLSQVLWAAQGITHRQGLRAVPSAGATYPLEVYIVAGEAGVEGLPPGIYHYLPEAHSLELVRAGDWRASLAAAALSALRTPILCSEGQRFLREAPVDIAIAAVYSRTTRVYGQRGSQRYIPMEVGHAGQNIHLQAEALGLGTVAVGAFDDIGVQSVLGVDASISPLYIMPLGKPQKEAI